MLVLNLNLCKVRNSQLIDHIVESATEVYNILLDGHGEKAYERALRDTWSCHGSSFQQKLDFFVEAGALQRLMRQ